MTIFDTILAAIAVASTLLWLCAREDLRRSHAALIRENREKREFIARNQELEARQ